MEVWWGSFEVVIGMGGCGKTDFLIFDAGRRSRAPSAAPLLVGAGEADFLIFYAG